VEAAAAAAVEAAAAAVAATQPASRLACLAETLHNVW